jgi:DNA transformation protein
MFGGKGVYVDGVIVAVEVDDRLLLKADALTAPQFAAAGSVQWTYTGKSGGVARMPYWTLPDEALDDDDRRTHWARIAIAAGRRAKRG